MKTLLILLLQAYVLIGCSSVPEKKIIIENSTNFVRNHEMVEITAASLGIASFENYLLVDANNVEVPYQVMYYGEPFAKSIVFQTSTKPNSKSTYSLKKGDRAVVTPLVFARLVPERKDDMAWENDFGAYRMYGPAAKVDGATNGVDFWLKRTTELVVDTFYHADIVLKISYHIDHGKGMDCYTVGNKLGAGGVAPFADDHLWVGNHFDTYKVLENGPLRAVFELGYNNVTVANATLSQTIRITVDAGSIVNKAEVVYTGDPIAMQLAGGIYLHDIVDVMQESVQEGWIAYAENAMTRIGPAGRNYISVIMPNMVNTRVYDETLLALANYNVGDTLTYYFGGGWSKWKHPTDESWFEATSTKAILLASPLTITVQN